MWAQCLVKECVTVAPLTTPLAPSSPVWQYPQVRQSIIFIYCYVFFVDTVPYPLSTQQIIDCTNGISDGNGTVMFRQNSNCKAGYSDLHLKWLLETQEPLQSAQQYPLLPEGSDPNPGQCRRAYRPVYGYGADYYIHINKRQVWNGHSLFICMYLRISVHLENVSRFLHHFCLTMSINTFPTRKNCSNWSRMVQWSLGLMLLLPF